MEKKTFINLFWEEQEIIEDEIENTSKEIKEEVIEILLWQLNLFSQEEK